MEVYIEKEDCIKNVEGKNIKEILDKLKINPATVMIVKNDCLVSEDSEITKGDKIKLLSVISGG